jgi:branched-chain amino acid transport system ATP-binding protein
MTALPDANSPVPPPPPPAGGPLGEPSLPTRHSPVPPPPPGTATGDIILSTSSLTIRFGGHVAVADADLDVERGTVTGLIGPNGAGKTTTFNAICGVLAPSHGTVRFDGKDITKLSTHRRAQAGIGRTFQRLEVFASMTAFENVRVGAEIRRNWRGVGAAPQLLAPAGADLSPEEEAELLIGRLGLTAVAHTRVGSLPTGQARLVELGRALAIRPTLLLLDEPASGLDDNESATFGDLLEELANDGMSVLLVEHDVELVMKVCTRIHVLDFGRVIASGTPTEIQANRAVQEAYLGSEAA